MPENQDLSGPKGPSFGEVLDSFFGFNVRSIRTLVATLVLPVTVARAGLAGETERFVSPLRIFIFIFGLTIALAALVQPGGSALFGGFTDQAEAVDAWLAQSGATREQIDAAYGFWLGILSWPIMIVSSAPYILLFKAYRPSRTLYGHTIVYLVTNNAASVIMLVTVIIAWPLLGNGPALGSGFVAMMVAYLYISLRLLHGLYGNGLVGTALRLLGVIALIPPTALLSLALQLLSAEALLRLQFQLSYLELFVQLSNGTPT